MLYILMCLFWLPLESFNVVPYFSHLGDGFLFHLAFCLLPHLLPKIDLTARKEEKSSGLPEFQ